ncbi:hypothetical protein ASG33_10260 [Dyadobacter sp. Leaf189]|nr:hypothetical protein ASG33_10260 [Dyadobacter sp. Leaf189]
MGIYVNADDIAVAIRKGTFTFSSYEVESTKEEILDFACESGLLNPNFNIQELSHSFELSGLRIIIKRLPNCERLAQIIVRFLREKLLAAKRRFSFETVFSHESNLDIMRRASEMGYKVYLYFVSTEDAEINKYRVALRVKKKGHSVPADRIESRYYRSLGFVRQANDIAYQAFFFDNSIDNAPFRLVGHFRKVGDEKVWDETDLSNTAGWFNKYCI